MTQRKRVPTMFAIVSVTLLLIVCVGLRAFKARGMPLWVDEVFSLHLANQKTISDWLSYQIHDANPPLSYLILKAWMHLISDKTYLRYLSILFSALAFIALFLISRYFEGFWVGIFASAIFAIHPLAIYYGREVRHPAISSFIALLVLYAFVKILKSPKLVFFLLYFLPAVLLMWTHYYAGFLIVSHLILLLVFLKGRRVEVLALGLAIALGFLPWLGVMKVQWLFGQPREPLPLLLEGVLLWVFYFIGGSEWEPAAIPIIEIPFAQPKYFLALFFLSLPMLIALFYGASKRHLLPVTASLIFPIILALTVSKFEPVFRPKYFFMYFPFFCILVASGLFKSNGQIRAWLAWSLFAILGISAMQVYHSPEFERERWNEAAKWVNKNEDFRCAVAFYSYYPGAEAFEYYYRGNCSIETFSRSPYFQKASERTAMNWARKLAENYDLIWLVDYLPHIHDPEGSIKDKVSELFWEIDFLNFNSRRFKMMAFATNAETRMEFFGSRISFEKGLFLKEQLLEGVETGKLGEPAWLEKEARILLGYENENALFLKLLPPYDLLPGQEVRIVVKVEGDTVIDMVLDRTRSPYLLALLPRRYDKKVLEVEILSDRTIVVDEGAETKKSMMISEIRLSTEGCEVVR